MKKTKILSVLLASLACAALLGSCDYWKEDFYKNGGDSGSQASGGSGSTASSVPTYSGSMTVNGASYTTLAMNGTSTSGTATLSGAAGSLSGTYARAVAAAAVASEFTGSYTITFSSGTITVTFNGNSITLTNGSITASGTGTLVVQASSGSTGSSTGAGIPDPEQHVMTAEEQAVYNSFLGTRYRFPGPSATETYIFNADGTLIKQDDDGSIRIHEHWWIEREGNYAWYDNNWVKHEVPQYYLESRYWDTESWCADGEGERVCDEDGDGIYDLGSWKRL